MQKFNNELLSKILQKNHSCTFFMDKSLSLLSSSSSIKHGYTSIDEFREKVPLTTYDDYRDYIDRMIDNGEKNVINCDKAIYFAITSGTTGKNKHIPITLTMMKNIIMLFSLGSSVIWRSLRASFPSPEQRPFELQSVKKDIMFQRSKDGTPIGQISQAVSVISLSSASRILSSISGFIEVDLLKEIADFETSTFVQLVFALAVPDLYSYSTILRVRVSIATTLPGNSMLLELYLVKWPKHCYRRSSSLKLKNQ
jgi:hypothetical protein